MANDVTRNPWVLDTVGIVWGTVAQPLPARIGQIEFAGYSVDTDTCEVQDLDSKTIWIGNGAADLETVRSGKIGWSHRGLKVSTLTAGKVYVYIE
jgi:hypothetical protein